MKNHFKQQILDGVTQFGIWNGITNTYVGEICAGAGFDWMVIDSEHGPFTLEQILHQLQAVARYPIHPIVRIPNKDAAFIKRVLDLGAQTLVIPMVETVEEAKALVSATRYAPVGIRGVGGGLARAAQWDRIPNYYKQSNENICLVIQIETVTGINNLQAIAELDGVDVVFFGAADLAASMDLLGQANHPDVMAQVERGIKQARALGKGAGFLTANPEIARHYMQFGANMAGVAIDTILLAEATKRVADSFRA